MPPQYLQMLIIGGFIVLMMLFMSRSAKKARARMLAEQEEAVQVGKNVVTTAGFFGRIVDIDGDAVTLMSPSGDETVWLKSAIRGEAELPLAFVDEDLDEDVEETTLDEETHPTNNGSAAAQN